MLALHEQTREVARLADQDLIEALQRLLSHERRTHARLLLHIAEVDARGLYREHAFSSMFEYCVEALHMSEAEAYLRIRAARLGREFPRVLVMLEAGELHLSSIKQLAPVLTAQNANELLEAARFKSKRELEVLLAARFEKPDVSSSIRRLPQRSTGTAAVPAPLALDAAVKEPIAQPSVPRAEPTAEPQFRLQAPASAATRPCVEPLGPARYKLQLSAGQELHDKVQQARELMRHELPDGDLAQIVERALDLLIADRTKRRFGIGRKPRVKASAKKDPAPANSRHIPVAVRREVVARDGMRCTFVSSEGRQCAQRGWLQLHHEDPYGRGGPGTTDNIRVLCHAHNQLRAEHDYGRGFMKQRIEQARRQRATQRLAPEPAAPVTQGS